LKKKIPIFQKVAQTVSKPKEVNFENIYHVAQFELKAQKHPHQTTFVTLKYLQQTML
jgi:hypothetical protein